MAWLLAAFSSVPFLFAFLSDVPTSLGALYFMLCSSPRTRLGLVHAWMIGGRGNGKCQACMNLKRPLLQLFPPEIAYRSPPVLFHSSRGVHHTTSSCAKKHRGERVPRYVVSRLFYRPSERLVTILGGPITFSSNFHSSYPRVYNSTLIFPCARNMIGIRTSLPCHYTARSRMVIHVRG